MVYGDCCTGPRSQNSSQKRKVSLRGSRNIELIRRARAPTIPFQITMERKWGVSRDIDGGSKISGHSTGREVAGLYLDETTSPLGVVIPLLHLRWSKNHRCGAYGMFRIGREM